MGPKNKRRPAIARHNTGLRFRDIDATQRQGNVSEPAQLSLATRALIHELWGFAQPYL